VGYTRAHSHNGLLSQGPACWPTLVAFGQPTTHKVRPVRGQHVHKTRSARGHCGQRTLRGAVEVHRQHGLHLDHPHDSSYKPQDRDLEKVAGERVLTGEVVRAAATNGIEGGNGFQVGEGAPSTAC
jgi:hypothetical protein